MKKVVLTIRILEYNLKIAALSLEGTNTITDSEVLLM